MAIFDVRTEVHDVVDKIVFADSYGKEEGMESLTVANDLTKYEHNPKTVVLSDGRDELYIESKAHANNLIKALKKAIEWGWLD